jgi:isopenicillin-N N-acyltransferase-like protein
MFPIITITGNAHERGWQYGVATAKLIRHSIGSYARLFAHRRGITWRAACRESLNYLPAIADHAPDLLNEMRGIADGANVGFEEILALNARTELLAGAGLFVQHPDHDHALAQNRVDGVAQPPDIGECTTLAVTAPATQHTATYLAQTWDWSGDQRGACVVLRICQPNAPVVTTLTEAGIVGKIGMNRAGIAVSLNIMQSVNDGKEAGLPVHIMLRKVLSMTSMNEVSAFFAHVKPAASSCITIAHRNGLIASYEITPSAVACFEPIEGILAHTNHCVLDPTRKVEKTLPQTSSSKPRLNQAQNLLNQNKYNINEQVLMHILRDESEGAMSICRKPDMRLHPCDRMESVLGVVMHLNKEVMHVADNVPSLAIFEALEAF